MASFPMRRVISVAAISAVAAVGFGSMVQDASTIAGAFELRDGVTVDPATGLMYIMSPRGGLEAFSLETGVRAWTTKEAAKPLTVINDQLVAVQEPTGENELQLVTLDRKTGSIEKKTQLTLPEGVRPAVQDHLLGRFQLNGFEMNGEVVVMWRQPQVPLRGIDVEDTPEQPSQRGALRFEPQSGRASTVPALEEQALNRLSNTRARSETKLNAGEAYVEGISSDGRHLMRSRRIGTPSGDHFVWQISDRTTGTSVGELKGQETAFSPFFVRDGVVYLEAKAQSSVEGDRRVTKPLRIRAVELTTGDEIWSSPVRDTSYQGPLPP